jgi:hypothetical protein
MAIQLALDPEYLWEDIEFENYLYDVQYPHAANPFPVLIYRGEVSMCQIFLDCVPPDLIATMLQDLKTERSDIWCYRNGSDIDPNNALMYKALAIETWVQATAIPPAGRRGEYTGSIRPQRAAIEAAIEHFRYLRAIGRKSFFQNNVSILLELNFTPFLPPSRFQVWNIARSSYRIFYFGTSTTRRSPPIFKKLFYPWVKH